MTRSPPGHPHQTTHSAPDQPNAQADVKRVTTDHQLNQKFSGKRVSTDHQLNHTLLCQPARGLYRPPFIVSFPFLSSFLCRRPKLSGSLPTTNLTTSSQVSGSQPTTKLTIPYNANPQGVSTDHHLLYLFLFFSFPLPQA